MADSQLDSFGFVLQVKIIREIISFHKLFRSSLFKAYKNTLYMQKISDQAAICYPGMYRLWPDWNEY